MVRIIANLGGGEEIHGIYGGCIEFHIEFPSYPHDLSPRALFDEKQHESLLTKIKNGMRWAKERGLSFSLENYLQLDIILLVECLPGWEGLYDLIDSTLRPHSKYVEGPMKMGQKWIRVRWRTQAEQYIRAVRELLLALGVQINRSALKALDAFEEKLLSLLKELS